MCLFVELVNLFFKYKTEAGAYINLPSLDSYQLVSIYDRIFDDIHLVHSDRKDHPKAKTLTAHIIENLMKVFLCRFKELY